MFIKNVLELIACLGIVSACVAGRQIQMHEDKEGGKEARLIIQILDENKAPLKQAELSLQKITAWEDKDAAGFVRIDYGTPEKLSFSKELSLVYDFAESWNLVISAPGYFQESIRFPEKKERGLHWEDKGEYREIRRTVTLVKKEGETELGRRESWLKQEKDPKGARYFYLKEFDDLPNSTPAESSRSGAYLSVASPISFEEYEQLWAQGQFEKLPKTVSLCLNDGVAGDGFIPVQKDDLVRDVHHLVMAPESGYRKEIPLEVGADTLFLYFKLGKYYGKAYVYSVNSRAGRVDATVRMFFNPEPGDRNLRSAVLD